MKIILASKSPRRKYILENEGFEVEVDVSNFDEDSVQDSSDEALVMNIAKGKAMVVAPKHKDAIVVAADTMVFFKGERIGQQDNDVDAFNTLFRLSGTGHDVITGMYVINTKTGKVAIDSTKSKVHLQKVPNEVIKKYVASGLYKGKAGCYNINDPEFESFIDKVEGSFSNIMGLPKGKIKEMINKVAE